MITMNKETYEALKRIIKWTTECSYGETNYLIDKEFVNDIKQVENWINEVSKEYKKEKQFEGENMTNLDPDYCKEQQEIQNKE